MGDAYIIADDRRVSSWQRKTSLQTLIGSDKIKQLIAINGNRW